MLRSATLEEASYFFQAMLEISLLQYFSGGFQLKEGIDFTCYCFIKCVISFYLKKQLML
uniref:Uncharacterized protein n=1 Tax=Amphimedon queenslandica TaxID=400682 RepID=A0A1X7TFL4_AMPQE